jgi:hypothetical protein
MKECKHCGIDFNRHIVLVATVVGETEKRMTVEVSETQDRKLKNRKGEKLIAIPFRVGNQGEDLEFCSLNCYRGWLHEASKR